jgi:hypothetical protein
MSVDTAARYCRFMTDETTEPGRGAGVFVSDGARIVLLIREFTTRWDGK